MNVWTLFTRYNGDNVITVHATQYAAVKELQTWLDDFSDHAPPPAAASSEEAAEWCQSVADSMDISYHIEYQRVRE